jgi:hypothetical protein
MSATVRIDHNGSVTVLSTGGQPKVVKATRPGGRSRTTGTSSTRSRTAAQPRQCSIVVVLTTTMFPRRS